MSTLSQKESRMNRASIMSKINIDYFGSDYKMSKIDIDYKMGFKESGMRMDSIMSTLSNKESRMNRASVMSKINIDYFGSDYKMGSYDDIDGKSDDIIVVFEFLLNSC